MTDTALVFFGVASFLVLCVLPGVNDRRPLPLRVADRFFLWLTALALCIILSAWLGRLPNA